MGDNEMIWMDLPLAGTMIFFLLLSFLYAWGMLNVPVMGYDLKEQFAWDLAAMAGIAVVVSFATVFVWEIRLVLGINPLPTVHQVPWDLWWIFSAALPGMTFHRIRLNQYRQRRADKSDGQLMALQDRTREILRHQKETKQMLTEVLTLIGMQREAKEYLERLRDYHN
jgi:hypothetical protein